MKQKKNGECIVFPQPSDVSRNSDVGMSIGYMEVPPGGSIGAHTHDRLEAYIIVSGRAKMMAGDEIKAVSAGDVLIAPVGTPHAIEVLGSDPLVFYALNSPPVETCPMVDAPEAVKKKFSDTEV
jgi:mannose-6-phosphate isomerase-like protein (cupin superfamily)